MISSNLLQLNLNVVDNSNVKVKRIGQKYLYFNHKRKGRITLNSSHKIRTLSCPEQACLMRLRFPHNRAP